VVVFPGVPPFPNVGREGTAGGSPGFGGLPLARLVAAFRAHAASLSALSPVSSAGVTPVSCSDHSPFSRRLAHKSPPGVPGKFERKADDFKVAALPQKQVSYRHIHFRRSL
jgi:hypothetical protein